MGYKNEGQTGATGTVVSSIMKRGDSIVAISGLFAGMQESSG